MIYEKKLNSPTYFPPMVANGDLSLSVDPEGGTNFMETDFGGMKAFDGYIYRAGRRLSITRKTPPAEMIGMGRLLFSEGSEMVDFSQELCENCGLVRSRAYYADGVEIETESFVLRGAGIYLVRKNFIGIGEKKVSFTYHFGSYSDRTEEVIASAKTEPAENGGKVSFKIFGQDIYRGEARFICLSGADVSLSERDVTLTVKAREGESLVFALLIEDSMDGDDYAERIGTEAALLFEKGYEELRAENEADWKEFFDLGFVKLGNERLNEVYRTALYHLRSYTTRWSIPVGLYPVCWSGKFFAFDEYYSAQALMEANRMELAKRVPDFRLNVCYNEAVRRATNGRDPKEALFHWQTSEYGHEVGTMGFWNEHIFHMAVVALGAWEYYQYSHDKEFLEKCYKMIRACAVYYTNHCLYKDGDRYYIGKCTDLERMGPSVENPFMTVCGVIRTLECLVAAADELGADDKAYRDECEFVAKKLRENLPQNDEMYIPYVGCAQKTIGMFSAKYPFDILEKDDEKMHAAWDDYILNEEKFGNCYAVGKKVSPWYACWKANGFARCGMGKEAYESAIQSLESVGVFGEMYEINEPGKRYRPWFTTAAGVFMSAIHNMLVQCDGETVDILPAYPIDEDLSFRLAIRGGAVIDAEVKDGKLVRADITTRDGSPASFKIKFKGNIC